jgi:hypothetical protein
MKPEFWIHPKTLTAINLNEILAVGPDLEGEKGDVEVMFKDGHRLILEKRNGEVESFFTALTSWNMRS